MTTKATQGDALYRILLAHTVSCRACEAAKSPCSAARQLKREWKASR